MITKKKPRCQCDGEGILKFGMDTLYDREKELPFVNHKPNECNCKNDLRRYERKGKIIWLCSCCCLPTDKEIK